VDYFKVILSAQLYSDWATGWTTGVRFLPGAENFLFAAVSRPVVGPTYPILSNGYREHFPRG